MSSFHPTNCKLISLPHLFFAIIALLGNGLTQGQEASKPLFWLKTTEPMSDVLDLEFSPDEKFLYTAGRDKRVRVWRIESQNNQFKLNLENELHWPIERGQNGIINSIAVSPNGKRLAVGGVNAFERGDIRVFDLDSNQQSSVLQGITFPISDLQFDSTGTKILASSIRGEVTVFDLKDSGKLQTIQDAQPVDKPNGGFPISRVKFTATFQNDSKIIFPRFAGMEKKNVTWKFGGTPLTDTVKTRSFTSQKPIIFESTSSKARNNEIIVAGFGGRVQITNLQTNQSKDVRVLDRNNMRFAKRVRWNGSTAVLAMNPHRSQGSASIEVFTRASMWQQGANAQPIFKSDDFVGDKCISVGISSSGNLVAASLEDKGICLWDLKSRQQAVVASPLKQNRRTRALVNNGVVETGRKQMLNLKELQIQDLDNEQVANVSTLVTLTDPQKQKCLSLIGKIRKGVQLGKALKINSPGWSSIVVPAFEQRYQLPLVLVFETKNDQPVQFSRAFQANTSQIKSLSYNQQNGVLSVAGQNSVVQFFSLKPEPSNPDWSTAWGASLRIDGQSILIDNVKKNGIASSRGLKNGDKIKKLGWTNELRNYTESSDSAKMMTVLKSYLSIGEHVKFVLANGQTKSIRCAWEPMASMFWEEKDWAIWTGKGYYASSALGDKRCGWLINPEERNGKARFLEASQFRQDFERPDVIKRMFETGDLDGAIEFLANNQPSFNAIAQKQPQLTIIKPAIEITKPDQPFDIVVEAENLSDLENLRIAGLSNSLKLPAPDIQQLAAKKVKLTWKNVQSQPGKNVFNVLVRRKGSTNDRYESRASRTVAQVKPVLAPDPKKEPKPNRVFLLAVGVNGQGLTQCRRDATTFRGSFQQSVRRNPTKMQIVEHPELTSVITDDEVTFGNFVNWIAWVRKQKDLNSNDLVVLFAACHGNVADGKFYLELENEKIYWDDVEEELMKLPCRKLVIADTCHSGAIGNSIFKADPTQQIRSADLNGFNLLAACGPGENSEEFRGDPGKQNGVFTYYLNRAILGSAPEFDNDDARIGFDEIYTHVEDNVKTTSIVMAKRLRESQGQRGSALIKSTQNPFFVTNQWSDSIFGR